MATYQQRKTDPSDPVDPAHNVQVNQRSAPDSASSMTGIIIAVVVLLIGAILAFNYGWFDGPDGSTVTQNNTTTETVPQATAPDTSSSTSTTVTEPDTSTSTTTTTEPSATGTGTTTTTTDP